MVGIQSSDWLVLWHVWSGSFFVASAGPKETEEELDLKEEREARNAAHDAVQARQAAVVREGKRSVGWEAHACCSVLTNAEMHVMEQFHSVWTHPCLFPHLGFSCQPASLAIGWSLV